MIVARRSVCGLFASAFVSVRTLFVGVVSKRSRAAARVRACATTLPLVVVLKRRRMTQTVRLSQRDWVCHGRNETLTEPVGVD